MKLVTAAQMRALDRAATDKYGISSLELMERAGAGVSEVINRHFPKKGLAAVVVGKGNNGGDGLVIARYLKKAGFDVEVFLTSPWTEFSPDARINWDRLAGLGINAHEIVSELKEQLEGLKKATCIVDAIFGTGLAQEVKGKYRTVIEELNSLHKPIVSVDIPSGLSADTGKPLGVAVRAKYTVTLGLGKVGLFTATGSEHSKAVEVIDIGIPKKLIDDTDTGLYLTTPDMFTGHFKRRAKETHKGDYGHILVIGGASGKMGAGLLTSRAGLRIGAGLVTYALPSGAFAKFDTKNAEIMYEELPDKGLGRLTKDALPVLKGIFFKKDVIAIGPGLGTADDTKAAVIDIVKKGQIPMVIDADGLNCLAGNLTAVAGKKTPVVLTPHPGEMARLIGKDIKFVQSDRVEVAKQFAKGHSLYVVLKGYRTIIATPKGDIYINPTGNPGMATAGMGDVLTGVIAGLMGQGIPPCDAVVAGVYLHGLAGDMAAGEIGERGLLASDVINLLPKAIEEAIEKVFAHGERPAHGELVEP